MYKAHFNKNTGKMQSLKEHSENTAFLAKDFAIDALKNIAFISGLFHDIGKYQNSFQEKISTGKNLKVEHSTCGAIALKEYYDNITSLLLSYCIAGHHSGIPDGGNVVDSTDDITLNGRLKRQFEDFSQFKEELIIPSLSDQPLKEFLARDCSDSNILLEKFAFTTRYIFSCLTDGDSIDTAKFYHQQQDSSLKADFALCLRLINENLSSFTATTPLQKARSALQNQVFSNIDQKGEIFLLNMPTGSGKTLCSMKAALMRLLQDNTKKRIIYIIPYNSIIEQTATTFENIFADNMDILQHHCTYYGDDESELNYACIKNATENWDAPVIITTFVQFFESIYDNKRSRLRKLHNIADSILIFDEAHLLPEEYLQPALQGIAFITKYLNSEAFFLTATMPNFSELIKKYALPNSLIVDLLPNKTEFSKFKKCEFRNLNQISLENLIEMNAKYPTSLIVVNARKTAKNIYTMLNGEKYHLSTYMTSFDRKNTIIKIKERLQKLEEDFPALQNVPSDRKITVVSTSLIEAGVDLDFSTVFRQLAGLDNILQAGGRCNREGKRKNAAVFIFRLQEERENAISTKYQYAKENLLAFADIASAESISCYYRKLFSEQNKNIEKHRLKNYCSNIKSIPFKSYAEDFKLIRDNISIAVAENEESRLLIENLKNGLGNKRLLQKYSLSVYENELQELQQQHVVENYDGVWCLTNNDYYDSQTGICFEGKYYII